MRKEIKYTITSCFSCPHLWAGVECTKLDRYFTDDEIKANEIPSWCPLPDAKEKTE